MKLIIDIDDETVEICKAWAKTTTVFSAEIKAIANGTLYEERPQGEWLHPYPVDIACECSICHLQMPITDYFYFCPNCGADMRGGKNAET